MHTRTQHSSSNRVCKRTLSLYIISMVYYVLADAEGGGARTPPLFAEGLLVSALLGGFDCFAAAALEGGGLAMGSMTTFT